MADKKSSIPIAAAIKSLRAELAEALAEGQGKDINFQLGPVELEFQVEVSWDAKGSAEAKGGINFGIVSLGEVLGSGEVNRSSGKTHTIKLTLNPVTSSGGSMQVSDSVSEEPG